MSQRDKQREEAVASSPMVGGRRNAQKSAVQIAPKPQKENVSERETPKNVSERETKKTHILSVSEPETKDGGAQYTGANLPLSEITPWSFANRPADEFGSDEEWHEFVQSIKNDGVDQPVTVRPKKDGKGYDLICGRRRYEASLEAGRETIPCIVRDIDDVQAAVIQDRENELRQDLTTFSRARSWQQLLDEGVFKNKSQLGVAMGLDRRYVHKVMVYNRIPREVLEAVRQCGAIGMGLAQEIVNFTTVKDGQDQKQVAKNIEGIKSLADKISQGRFTATGFRAAMSKILNGETKKPVQDKLPKNIGKVNGVNCFNVRRDSNGTPTISILKEARDLVDIKDIAEILRDMFDDVTKKK